MGTMTVRLMDFYADWCGPCKTQDPILEEVVEEYSTVEFQKVDVDNEQDVANQYQVRSLPTLIVENDDGVDFLPDPTDELAPVRGLPNGARREG